MLEENNDKSVGIHGILTYTRTAGKADLEAGNHD
jgi:hypothetical protein